MKIRKIAYHIDFIHLITFRDYYREIVAPYFNYKDLQYSIDNENSIHETVTFIFKNEYFTLQFKKDGATFVYEGDIADIKKNHPITSIFFEITDKIKKVIGFTKVTRHKVTLHGVDIYKADEIQEMLKKNSYIHNPYKELTEFAALYEFSEDGNKCRLQFGNYSEKDILKFDLSPFKTEYNEDLKTSVGLMAELTVTEEIQTNSLNKLKQLLEFSENILSKYEIKHG